MPEQIFLEGSKQSIFLGACQIYSSILRTEAIKNDDDEDKCLAKAVINAVKIANLVENETCLEGEACDDKDLWRKE
jgi:hypothetical protein